MDILDFVGKWTKSGGAERANSQHFLLDLCDALRVPRPSSDQAAVDAGDYVFEADALAVHEGGRLSVRKMDPFKRGAFILESKQGSDEGSSKIGTAKRDTPAWQGKKR